MESHTIVNMWTRFSVAARQTAVISLLYLLLVLLMTWPATPNLSTRLIGNNIDNWIFYWNNWWLGQALSSGSSFWQTELIFYPTGTSLVTHSHSLLNSFAALLLNPLAGPIAAYNLTFLAGLWLSAVGMFLFVRELTGAATAAFLAGLIFAFAPYHMTQALAHLHLGSIQWWPFFALMLHRLGQRPAWRYVVGTAVFAALTLYTGYHLALLLGLWAMVYMGQALGANGVTGGNYSIIGKVGHYVPYLLLTLLLTLLLSWPLLAPLLGDVSGVLAASATFDESTVQQTDLLAYVVPPTYHPLWGDAVQPIYERFRANRAAMPFLGYSVLLLLLVGLRDRWPQTRAWGLSALIWLLLAMGPMLRLNGTLIDLPLPYRWLGQLFPFSAIRAPDRFNLLLLFVVAVLAAYGLIALQARWRLALIPAVLLLLLEFLPLPLPLWQLPATSPAIPQLETAVLDYPMGYTQSKLWLYYQTLHGQPTVEGHLSRYDDSTYAFILERPLLQALYNPKDQPVYLSSDALPHEPMPPQAALGPALRDLRASGVETLVLHKSYADTTDLQRLQQQLPLVPGYEDDLVAIFDLATPFPWHFGRPPLPLTAEITLLQAVPQIQNGSLQLDLLARLDGMTTAVSCTFTAGAMKARPFTLFPVDTAWQTGDLHHLQLELPLPAGSETAQALQLQCGTATAILLPAKLQPVSGRWLLLQDGPTRQFGPAITLHGTRWWTEGSQLQLELIWETAAPLAEEYKLFVHLLDEKGQIVRQYDTLPCNWACPTTSWQPNTPIIDRATLPLWGLPAGSYRLALGLYNPDSGVRLTAVANNVPIPDNYLILPAHLIVQQGE